MKSRGSHLPAVLLALALVLGAAATSRAAGPATVAELLRTPDNLAFLQAPDRIEVSLLTLKDRRFFHKTGQPRYVEGPGKVLPAREAGALAGWLASDATYGWATDTAALPAWNVRVKFIRGDSHLSADICFNHDLVLFGRDGLPFAAEDFRDPDNTLFALVQGLFPRDRQMRALAAARKSRDLERAALQQSIELKAAAAAARHTANTP